MVDIFQALAHPIRRGILDRLRGKEGQTLSELVEGQPVTRFGVMKHLGILEEAHLIVTRKAGREKLHYLNPLPIQQVADRWISRFTAPFTRTLQDLSAIAERGTIMLEETSPTHVWEMYIRATPETVWNILTDDAKTPLWQHFNMTSRTEWHPGGRIVFLLGDREMIVGEVLEMDPPTRFVHSFRAQWAPDVAGDPPSRVTWLLEPVGQGACKLTLTHDDFGGATATSKAITGGWPEALSRLKTLAETGEPFLMPPPDFGG